ncbi:MAG TPA: asparagine synthase (glutamine-hydrolyzing) [Cytophagales bacterium]|nr:asparagine synthase (glutamine-hydrolyzing) [Cytophagales bacterium]
MCGITGVLAFNEIGRFPMINLAQATQGLARRGPDHQGTYVEDRYGVGHRRLSIIDLRPDANQPMKDPSERYVLAYNGEIYNWRSLRQELESKGIEFRTECDTELLLQLLIHEGRDGLQKLNGFFAFAFYDTQTQHLLLGRDRMGIKPLYFFHDESKVLFGSELKALLAYGIPKEIDHEALFTYLQLNYTPAPHTMLAGVKKLPPGHVLEVKEKQVTTQAWYTVPFSPNGQNRNSYDQQQKQLVELMEESVAMRLAADVPVGSFLSGGIDSSVIAALATRHTERLHTFSIGYADEPYFDETHYAKLVAAKLGTEHTVFSVTNRDLFEILHIVLDYLDEPFADSSALPVYLVSQLTRKHATVALSGDGADELFSGYNKHAAFWRMANPGWKENAVIGLRGLWKLLPKSRQNPLGNRIRQFARFAEAAKLSPMERYWAWASLASGVESYDLLSVEARGKLDTEAFIRRKAALLAMVQKGTVQEALHADATLVLPDDMLTKVDRMSMANSLEVRVPFLDHRVVEFAMDLPESSKITGTIRKRIVQDAFRDLLPAELYQRPKHGFEVPLLKWMQTDLKLLITNDLLSGELVKEQNLFDPSEVNQLLNQLFSRNPGDAHARVWALVVFQNWWKKYFT